MNRPKLDPRTKRELTEQIKRRAGEYVPEWRFDPQDTRDPGAAIAELFAEMFGQTVDRFNLVPSKYYTEFLNLLGTQAPRVSPASGYMLFGAGGADEPVSVPEGTEVFAPGGEGVDDIVFATERKIQVTTATVADTYFVDAKGGVIEKLDMAKEQPFFASAGGENIQRHRFAICEEDVLALSGECEIEVTIRQSAGFMEEGTAKRLADAKFAVWSWFDGEKYVPFDSVAAMNSSVILKKTGEGALKADAEGRVCIVCDAKPETGGSVTVAGIALKSAMAKPVDADYMANNDVAIDAAEGGYCFSRRIAPYELFYVRSDDIFRKHGANIKLSPEIVPIIYSDVDKTPRYEFNKRVISKSDAVTIVPDDVYVEQVIWEYYNGSGWARLPVRGNVNPFSCKDSAEQVVLFTVPKDMSPVLVNAEKGYFIRARVVNVANYFSTVPRWILPFIKSMKCEYEYSENVPASALYAENNGKKRMVTDTEGIEDLNLTLIEAMPPEYRAVYFRFNGSPHAMPLSLLFDMLGETKLSSKIVYEALYDDGFKPIRAIDRTGNLERTGNVFLYLTDRLEKRELFGEMGCWVRMCLSGEWREGSRAPTVAALCLNTVNAIQRQKAPDQLFNTEAYEANKAVQLLEKPVLSCQVWVDEINGIAASEIERLKESNPDDVDITTGENGIEHCYVRWKETKALKLCSGERVYELDSGEGIVRFGSGPDGKVPPRGDLNIRVSYTYGGGEKGNLPIGAVNALVGSIPRINVIKNIVPMCGGTDKTAMEKLEELANRRIRHRDRAIGVFDYESMTLSAFERASRVKCFANTDEKGGYAPGHVCLVVMSRDVDERVSFELAKDVYEYLKVRCDCNLTADGRLHVVPSTMMTISAEVNVVLRDLDMAAVTQQRIADSLTKLIDSTWRTREIGEQISIAELYKTVRAEKNVRAVERILCSGSYYDGGRRCLTALDGDRVFPFATVCSGPHLVRVR